MKARSVKARRWKVAVLPTILLGLLLSPAAGQGQGLPGVPGGGGFAGGRNMAEFYGEVTARTAELFAVWRERWVEDNPQALAELYSPDAMLYLPDRSPIFTSGMIAEAFAELLPETGEIQAGMLDFDASGKIAYIFGKFTLDFRDANGVRHQITGDHITVAKREGRDWKIRSQMFRKDPPQPDPPAED